jgi:hypothetical protein
MAKNKNKGSAYKLVLSNLKSCAGSEDIFHLIGLLPLHNGLYQIDFLLFYVELQTKTLLTGKKKYVTFIVVNSLDLVKRVSE